jgi:hypothetical protein
VPAADYFSANNLSERIRNYVRVSNVPQEFAERYLMEESTQQFHAADPSGAGGHEENDDQKSVNPTAA